MRDITRRSTAALLSSAVVAAFLMPSGPTLAREVKGVSVTLPQDIQFKSPPAVGPAVAPAGGPTVANLFGDPTKAELYVQQIKIPAGFKFMPHWHPEAARTVLVLSGTLYYANGEQWDESKLKAFPVGTFFVEPSKVPHYAWAKDGEVLLQLTAIGPTGTTMLAQGAEMQH